MENLAKRNNLEFHKDVTLIGAGSPEEFKRHIDTNQNKTQAAVIFCTDTWEVKMPKISKNGKNKNYNNSTLFAADGYTSDDDDINDADNDNFGGLDDDFSVNIPCKLNRLEQDGKKMIFYSLAYNSSLGFKNPYFTDDTTAYPINMIAAATKKAIDETIISYFGQKSKTPKISPNFSLDLSHQDYPKTALRFKKGSSFVVSMGSFFFYIPIAISFLIIITEMLTE